MIQHNGMGFTNPQQYYYTGVPQAQPKIMNVLSDEEIKLLQQNQAQFSLGLTEKERLQGICSHRLPDGSGDSLVYDQFTGVARCTICGYEFRPIDAETSIEDITEAKDKIIDILQTIKLLYTDLPAEAAKEYFQIIPLIGKIPQLFEFAAKNFAKHEMNAWQYSGQNMNGINLLQNLGNILGAGMPNPMYQQPMQPTMQPQPMAGYAAGYPAGAYAQPQQPMMNPAMANPFGYQGASQPQMAPVNQGYAYQPGATAPVAPTVTAPAAPAPQAKAESETVTSEVKI